MLAKDLRLRAEDVVRMSRREIATLTDQQEIQRLVHELQVHQVELEMQNESLHAAQLRTDQLREQYQNLFEGAPVGYLMLDARGAIECINPAGLALLQTTPLRALGHLLSSFVVPRDWLVLQEQLHGVHRMGSSSCEVRVITPDNGALHVRVDISLAVGDVGECLVVLTNIEERKHHQEALEHTNRALEERVAARTGELAARNRELEAENAARIRSEKQQHELEARLRESDRFESLGLLAAGIAHDFNNLLVSVVANADLLLQTPLIPASWRESLSLIKRAGSNASELTRRLLVFAGHGELRMSAVHLPQVVSSTVELMRGSLASGIELTTDIDDDLPAIDGDASQVQQVVTNLVTNAAEAISGRGYVSIRARVQVLDEAALAAFRQRKGARPGSFVILQVQDSGSGMDGETLTRIFDPFFSTKFTGRGLGLSSVLGIVQGHGGALGVQTRAGTGTRVEVAFRCAEQAPIGPAPVTPVDESWMGQGPLLVIDDDDSVRRMLTMMLKRLGFEVTAANGGRAGLEAFMHHEPPFRAVVLDWLMPGMPGEQVLRELRALQPTLPVLLVSGYSAQEFVPSDDAYLGRLQKPMSLQQLRDALRMILDDAPRAVAGERP